MATTTLSGNDFDQDSGRAMLAARGGQDSIIDLLSLPPWVEQAELEPSRPRDLTHAADLS